MAHKKVDVHHTEKVNHCSICGASDLNVEIDAPVDNVLYVKAFASSIVRCSSCSHSFLSTRLRPEKQFEAYDNYYTQSSRGNAPTGDLFSKFSFLFKVIYSMNLLARCRRGFWWVLIQLPVIGRFFLRSIRSINLFSKQLSILDVGCGNGEFLQRCRLMGIPAQGLDLDPASTDLCKKAGLSVECANLLEWESRETFSHVILSHVLEHVDDPIAYLRKIRMLLDNDGVVCITVPNFDSYGRKRFMRSWRGIDFPRHLQFFTYNSLMRAGEIAGYSKVHFISDLPQAMRIVRNSALIENLSPIRRLGAILMSLCLGLLDSKSSDVLVVEFYK